MENLIPVTEMKNVQKATKIHQNNRVSTCQGAYKPCSVENVSSRTVLVSGLECSYGKNFQLGYRDLGNRAGNFSHMNTPARIPGLSVTKHFQLSMACKRADKSKRGSTGILGTFWTFFISVTGIKFPICTEDKIRPAYRASPVTGLI